MNHKVIFQTLILLLSLFSWQASAQVNVTGSIAKDGQYSTLAAAFTAIGTSQKDMDIVVTLSGSTAEPAVGAVLNAGTWNSLKIYPTVSGVRITNAAPASFPLITLKGAKNVTIDGRVNATGSIKDLTINCTSNVSYQVNTINFAQNADGNTIQYCFLTGNVTTAAKGIVSFDVGTTGNGNGNNIIKNSTFTGNVDGKPINCIYSSGSTTYPNNGNQILDNDFKDFLSPDVASSGIYLYGSSSTASLNNNWIISGNSFYQTTPLIPTASVAYAAIQIGSGLYTVGGSGHTISNNYIGGSAPHCVGLWEKTNAFDNVFSAIKIYSDKIGSTNTIDNNTIQKFSWANSAGAVWKGIESLGGNVNIGIIAGNTIGDNTTTGSITVTAGAATGNYSGVTGIHISGTAGLVDCQNNKIGSITTANTLTTGNNSLYGIMLANYGYSTVNINNNTIGGSIANSMYCSSPSTTTLQELTGIYCKGRISHTVTNNTISNLTNSNNAATNIKGICVGVSFTHGTVTNNVIHDLICKNTNTDGQYGLASVVGISSNFNGYDLPVFVNGNTIYNLSNDNPAFIGYVTGISFVGGGTPITVNTCSGNFVNGLSVNASATGAHISGILTATGVSTISNNIISLDDNLSVQLSGITEGQANPVGNDSYIYHNTVYIGGTPTSGSAPSYAFYSASTANNRTLKNNLFVNTRTGGTGIHYGMTASATNLTRDFNDYVGVVSPVNDANSLNIDPKFLNAGGTSPTNYMTGYSVSLTGVSGTGVTTDYGNTSRNAGTPKMGAYETGADMDIVVVNGTPLTIDQNVNVANLTINPGANLTLNVGKTLNVTTFNINSNETNGTGTFVDKGTTNIAKANVQQYLTGSLGATYPDGRFWYVSSPVTGATSNTFNALSDGNKLWNYTESIHGYTEITDNTSDLIVGKGYAARLGATATVTLTGNGLKTGDHTFNLTRNEGNDKSGYNLIGNPYPSYLDWQAVTLPAGVMPTIWTRSCSAGGSMGFDTYNSSLQEGASSIGHINVSQYIAPLQAFWVKMASGNATGSFTVNNNLRSLSDQTTSGNKLKAPAFVTQKVLRLQVSNEINSDETVLAFNENASNDFDFYDSPKMTNDNVSIPEIYTLAGTEKVAINGMNNFMVGEQLPLGFTTGSSNTFAIKATDIRNFDTDTRIILKDNVTNTESDLTGGASYSFTSDVISSTSRFSIVFKTKSVTTGINDPSTDKRTLSIFKNVNGQITIVRKDANGEKGLITVCTSAGQKLISVPTTGSVTVLNKAFCSGVYLITLNVAGNVTTKKVVLN